MTVVSTQSHTPTAGRRVKSSAAFRTISEVAGELELPPHVLRFWESKFTQVRPLKRGGGRRYYRPEDVDLLRRIRELLYTEGYTIKGVQKLLREGRGKLPENDRVAPSAPSTVREVTAQGGNAELRRELRSAIEELKSLRDILDGK